MTPKNIQATNLLTAIGVAPASIQWRLMDPESGTVVSQEDWKAATTWPPMVDGKPSGWEPRDQEYEGKGLTLQQAFDIEMKAENSRMIAVRMGSDGKWTDQTEEQEVAAMDKVRAKAVEK